MSEISNHKLKIRIQVKPQPQAIETIYPEPEVSYQQGWDWRKIGAAALPPLLLLWMLGSFLLNNDNPAISRENPPTNSLTAIPGAEPDPLATAQPKLTQSPAPLVSTQAENAPSLTIIPRKKPTIASLANRSNRTEPAIPKTATQPKPSSTSDHPEVLRAQLSHAIKAREPIDNIDLVQLQSGESKAIYFYVHLKNLQGQKIRINWYHSNQLDSNLSLQVHNNNWRTQASKQLDERRLGGWRVELIDESGIQLATRSFTVIQR